MKVSLICPLYNEADSIKYLIESILSQSKKPDEIIFVDNFSTDGTVDIIKKYKGIKLIQAKSNISEARNIAVKAVKNDIIVCTDADSKLHKDWVKNMIKPFEDKSIDVVGGAYMAVGDTKREKLLAKITVPTVDRMHDDSFLPSGRSIAFKKKAWEAVGGYPEHLATGEDTLFDIRLREKGFKFKIAKDAISYWKPRASVKAFCKQFYKYGLGDGESKNIYRMKYYALAVYGFTLGSLVFPLTWTVYFLFEVMRYKSFTLGWLMLLKRIYYVAGVWRGLFNHL